MPRLRPDTHFRESETNQHPAIGYTDERHKLRHLGRQKAAGPRTGCGARALLPVRQTGLRLTQKRPGAARQGPAPRQMRTLHPYRNAVDAAFRPTPHGGGCCTQQNGGEQPPHKRGSAPTSLVGPAGQDRALNTMPIRPGLLGVDVMDQSNMRSVHRYGNGSGVNSRIDLKNDSPQRACTEFSRKKQSDSSRLCVRHRCTRRPPTMLPRDQTAPFDNAPVHIGQAFFRTRRSTNPRYLRGPTEAIRIRNENLQKSGGT